MTPRELLAMIRAAGVLVARVGDRLVADAPPSGFPFDLSDQFREAKPDIMQILRTEPESVLDELRASGLDASLDGGELVIEGPEPDDPSLLAAVRELKPQIVSLLDARRASSAPAITCPPRVELTASHPIVGATAPSNDQRVAEFAQAIENAGEVAISLTWSVASRLPDPILDRPSILHLALRDGTSLVAVADGARIERLRPALSKARVIGHDLQRTLCALQHNFEVRVSANWDEAAGPSIWDSATALRVVGGGLHLSRPSVVDLAFQLKQRLRVDLALDDGNGIAREHVEEATRLLFALRDDVERAVVASRVEGTVGLECTILPAVADIWLAGVGVDKEALSRLSVLRTDRYRRLDAELRRELNVGDMRDDGAVVAALNKLGANVKGRGKETLAIHKQNSRFAPLVLRVLEWNRLHAWEFGMGRALVDAASRYPDGRIRPTIDPLGAVTGRFSYSDPNLQALERATEVRRVFVAREGHVFVFCDLSQIELRILAHVTGDRRMIQMFRDREDAHRKAAEWTTGRRVFEQEPEDRDRGKIVNYGAIYGASAEGLASIALVQFGVPMSIEEAHELLTRYKRAFPEFDRWQMDRRRDRSSTCRTIGGRVRHFEGRESYTERLNSPIQGACADGLKVAHLHVHRTMHAVEGRVVVTRHDEIGMEVPEARAKDAAEYLSRWMKWAMAGLVKSVPIETDVFISKTWVKEKKP